MATEAMSPLGISWGYLTMLLLPLTAVSALAFAVVSRRHIKTSHRIAIASAAVAAGVWAFLTVGMPVYGTFRQAPGEKVECLIDPTGSNPERTYAWDDTCGRGLARRLALSAGPALLMVGYTAGAASRPLVDRRRRRRQDSLIAAG